MANMIGVNGVAQEIVKGWIGDSNGVAQEIEAGWIGDGSNLAQLFFLNGLSLFVAVGGSGYLAYSSDGIAWEVVKPLFDGAETTGTIKSITYGNGLFVVCLYYSNANTLYYSEDGVNFFKANLPSSLSTNTSGYHLAYGNGRFVGAVAASAKCLYSVDGITWTQGGWTYAYSMSYANGKFFAMHYGQNSKCSADGITWTAMTGLSTSTNKGYHSGVVYANGLYYAVDDLGDLYYSADGLTWTYKSGHPSGSESSARVRGMAYGNNVVAVVGYHPDADDCAYIDASGNYLQGTGLSAPSASKTFSAVTYNKKFVTVASDSIMGYSADGKTWTQIVVADTAIAFNDVCYSVDGGGKAS